MSDANEKVKEDVMKNPKNIFVTIQILLLQEKSIFEAYKEFCKILGDDVMEYNDFDFWWFRFLNGEFDLEYDRSKEPKKRELGDMPIKIVEKIIGKLKNEERYVLLNVSKRIRNVMEESNLVISNLYLQVYYDCIGIYFNGRNAKFEDSNPGTLVRIDGTERMVDGDYLTVAMNQLTRILTNPKLRFDTLTVVFEWRRRDMLEPTFNAVHNAFQSITHQLDVQKLKVTIDSGNQLMTILPYLKPRVLETIELFSQIRDLPGTRDFADSEQFRQAKSFFLIGFYFDAPIEKLLHFNNFEVMIETFSIEDMIRFKDAFIASPDFKHCHLAVGVLPRDEANVDVLRQVRDAFNGKVFAIPGSRDSIQIRVDRFEVSIDRVSN